MSFEIIGIDGGNNEVKVFGERGEDKFGSIYGEYRDRNFDTVFGPDDSVFEFGGKKFFGGRLAKYESEFSGSMMGESKAHTDTLIRVLRALHRQQTEVNRFKIGVGQPIKKHTKDEKEKIRKLLIGEHVFAVNDVSKTIIIEDVVVGAEGGVGFWSNPAKGKVHVMDFGSGTTNLATLIDGLYIDKESTSFNVGLNSTDVRDAASLVRKASIEAVKKKWEVDERVLITGGATEEILPLVQDYFNNVAVLLPVVPKLGEEGRRSLDSIFATSVGLYNVAKKVFS